MDMVEATERFAREVGGIDIPETPQRLGMQGKIRALDLFREELDTFENADVICNEAESLINLAYIALGRIVEMGLSPKALFEEVHARTLKSMKGQGPVRPDLQLLMTVGREAILRGSWRPKILIIGHAGHGKTTVCELLESRYGFRFAESGRFCATNVVMPYFDSIGQSYESIEACYEDRINHRQTWYNLIRDYNSPDATALAREILQNHDIYSGMRSADELINCRQARLFDHVVWVDRSEHVPPEPATSCTVMREMADRVIDNNSTPQQLVANVHNYVIGLYGRHMTTSLMREHAANRKKGTSE